MKKTSYQYRVDAVPVDDVQLLPPAEGPGGALLVEGIVARPGIYKYMMPDGSVRRELVPASSLWKRDSIGTLGRAPITIEHPPEMIDEDNVLKYSHGDVGEEIVEANGGFVKIRMALRSREAQDAVRAGKVQLSPGYRVETREESGVHPEFGRYDAIQVNRVYNHVAMTDQARGGDQMQFRTDSVLSGELMDLRSDDKSTPAKPSERVKGSKKNPSGSAGGKRGGIKISETVEKGLRNKVDQHNEKHGDTPSKKVDLGMLKAVYRRGAGAFSTSHRPGMTRNQWSMGRVNAFLRLVRTGKPKDAQYTNDNDLLPKGHPRADAEEMYSVPEAARNNAKKALRWLAEKEGARGMTPAGMRTARKLASGDKIPLSLVAKMAGFARHRKNAEVDPKYKNEPWRDAGYVAWLGWGGTTGVDFARKITGADEGDSMEEKDSYEEEEMKVDQEGCKECEGCEGCEESRSDAPEEVVEDAEEMAEDAEEEKEDKHTEEHKAEEEMAEDAEEEKADKHTEEHKAEEEMAEDAEEEKEDEEEMSEDAPLTASQLEAAMSEMLEKISGMMAPILKMVPQGEEEEMPGRTDALDMDSGTYHMKRTRLDALARDLEIEYEGCVSLADLARKVVHFARPEIRFDSDLDYIAAAEMVQSPNKAGVIRKDALEIPLTTKVRTTYGPSKG